MSRIRAGRERDQNSHQIETSENETRIVDQLTLLDGGTVTQATNKSTGVTLNTVVGQITMNNAALAAAAEVAFTVTNSKVTALSVIIVNVASGQTAAEEHLVWVGAVAAGSFDIAVSNLSGSSASDALVINFVVLGGADS